MNITKKYVRLSRADSRLVKEKYGSKYKPSNLHFRIVYNDGSQVDYKIKDSVMIFENVSNIFPLFYDTGEDSNDKIIVDFNVSDDLYLRAFNIDQYNCYPEYFPADKEQRFAFDYLFGVECFFKQDAIGNISKKVFHIKTCGYAITTALRFVFTISDLLSDPTSEGLSFFADYYNINAKNESPSDVGSLNKSEIVETSTDRLHNKLANSVLSHSLNRLRFLGN